jgi:hypothetical protein
MASYLVLKQAHLIMTLLLLLAKGIKSKNEIIIIGIRSMNFGYQIWILLGFQVWRHRIGLDFADILKIFARLVLNHRSFFKRHTICVRLNYQSMLLFRRRRRSLKLSCLFRGNFMDILCRMRYWVIRTAEFTASFFRRW